MDPKWRETVQALVASLIWLLAASSAEARSHQLAAAAADLVFDPLEFCEHEIPEEYVFFLVYE